MKMKAIEIISKVDELDPNQFGVERKLSWLAELDGQIFAELGEAYEPCWEQPGIYQTGEEELLVEFPYSDGVYRHFLQAMMAAENFEIGKYNQHMALFDSAYGQYRDCIMRTKMHTGAGKEFRF